MPLVVPAVALAFTAGATDITSFTRLGEVFSSVMTGNLVLLGLAVEQGSGALAAHAAVTFAGYIAGVVIASLICSGIRNENILWAPPVTATLVVELVVFVGFAVGWELAGSRPAGGSQFGLLIGASLAMGLQSEAIRHVGAEVSTTYLTGTLTTAVASVVSHRRPDTDNVMNLGVLVAAAVGAAAGGGLIATQPSLLPFLPLVAVAGVIAMASTVGTHV